MAIDPDRLSKGLALFRALAPDALERMESGIGQFAPDLVAYAADFPFGEVYQRDGLSKRDRQIVTLACLATRGDASAQLKVHMGIALALGLTAEELVEIIIQLIPYAGFPTAINAAAVLSELMTAPPETSSDA